MDKGYKYIFDENREYLQNTQYIYFLCQCSMNTHIWEVFPFLHKKYLFYLHVPVICKYLKYMNTRISEVFSILTKNIFNFVVYVVNTSNI